MKKNHTLYQNSGDKTVSLILSKNNLMTENAKKIKTEKSFRTSEQALKEFEKKEWEFLKKGYVLRNENPKGASAKDQDARRQENFDRQTRVSRVSLSKGGTRGSKFSDNEADGSFAEAPKGGDPALHFLVGTGYTGCLSFEETPRGIFVYKHGWYENATDQRDFLTVIDERGVVKETVELPEILPREILYVKEKKSLLLNLDNRIFEYSLESGYFRKLTEKANLPASFIAAGENRIAYGAYPKLFITDMKRKKIIKKNFEAETEKGTTYFCAAMSKNGNMLGIHGKKGQITIIETSTGKTVKKMKNTFLALAQMQFIDNDMTLIARELYDKRELRLFNIDSGKEIKHFGLEIPEYAKDIDHFCLNDDESKLVCIQRKKAFVFDFRKKKYSYNFTLDHCVRNAKSKFINKMLGVRTDLGCFSLYEIR